MRRGYSLTLVLFISISSSHAAFGAGAHHNFGIWDGEIAAFESSDRTNPPPKHGLLFTGSSTIRRWTTLTKDFPGQSVIGRGVGGSEVVDITHFADRIVFPYEPRMIFFRSGGNDINAGESVSNVFADYKEFVATVHAKMPETEIVFISWSATPARWKQNDKEQEYNKLVREYTKGLPYLKYCETSDMVLGADGKPRADLFVSDGLHFNAAGYKLLAARVRPFLPK